MDCRCVYDCDNDVCDSQMVNIQFKNGAVANLTMTAFTEAICKRHTRITGSKADISTLLAVLERIFFFRRIRIRIIFVKKFLTNPNPNFIRHL